MRKPFLLRKPWTTEKATAMSASQKYTFLVDANATKPEIRKAVNNFYRTEVDRVHVLNVVKRPTRFRGATQSGHELRKAIVTLKPGHKIDIGH